MNKKGVIDYSKWDKMDFSESEEEDDEDNDIGRGLPRVTRLDTPSQITTKSDGTVEVLPSPQKANATIKSSICEAIDVDKDATPNQRYGQIGDRDSMIIPADWTKNGSSYSDFQFNSRIESYWSQDRYEVILTLIIDNHNNDNLSSRDVQVKVKGLLVVPYADRFSATMSSTSTAEENSKTDLIVYKTSCENTVNENKDLLDKESIIFKGSLPYPIHLAEDEETVEWEITSENKNKSNNITNSCKIIRIIFRKAVPMQGLTIWWSHPLKHFPKIDVQNNIEGRENSKVMTTVNQNSNDMKKAWDEAHAMFLKKMKNKKSESVEIENK